MAEWIDGTIGQRLLGYSARSAFAQAIIPRMDAQQSIVIYVSTPLKQPKKAPFVPAIVILVVSNPDCW